jgi:hypothetical protein
MFIQETIINRSNATCSDFITDGISMSLFTLADGSKILTTNKLHEYTMPVSPKWKGREHTELAFYLPSYWDADAQCPNLKWTSSWLAKFAHHCISKNTWFGPGHTISTGKESTNLSPTMKMHNLIFTDPIELSEQLKPIKNQDKIIYFLTIFPIFGDEHDYKTTKGTQKFLEKYTLKNASEKLDDFRVSFLRSRWKMF